MNLIPPKNEGKSYATGERYGFIGAVFGFFTSLLLSIVLFFIFKENYILFIIPICTAAGFLTRRIIKKIDGKKNPDNALW